MAIPAWFWPPSGVAARSVALAPFGSGMAIADWVTPTIWPFGGSGTAAGITPGIVLATGTPGIGSMAPDGVSGVWALAWDGRLWHQPPTGAAALTSMPTGAVYVGCAAVPGSGFALAASGSVYKSDGTLLGSWPTYAWFMGSSGTTLATLLPASGVGVMTAGGGVTGLIALPAAITVPSCIDLVSGSPLAIAGWQNAPALSGAAAAMLDPQDSTAMLSVGSGFARIWKAPDAASENWAQTQALTGFTNLSAVAWRPDGTQAIAASATSGVVQVIGYTVGVLSLAQSLILTGACSVAVAGDSTHAVIAQSGQAQLTQISFGGSTWTAGAAVTGLPGITAVASFGPSGAVAAYTSGLAFLNLITGAWTVSNTLALGFAPTAVTVDPFLQVYAGGSGSVAVTSGATLLGSGSWAGSSPTSIAIHQGRIILAVPSDGAYYMFGESSLVPGTFTQQGSGSLALGSRVGLALSDTLLFTMGSGSTLTYGFSGSPFTLTPVLSGVASQWNGSSWTSTVLGIGHTPSACGHDASGTLWVTTIQNTLWNLTSGGTVLSSGIVTQYDPQPQTVPIGASALQAFNNGMYVSTSMPGVLVQVA